MAALGLQDSLTEESIEEQFRGFDLNGDGVIERDELRLVLRELDASVWTDDRVDSLLELVDSNKDGCIQLDEFFSWIFAARMLSCICGYTCGTRKALDKHIHRFSGKPAQDKHGISRRCVARTSLLPQRKFESDLPSVTESSLCVEDDTLILDGRTTAGRRATPLPFLSEFTGSSETMVSVPTPSGQDDYSNSDFIFDDSEKLRASVFPDSPTVSMPSTPASPVSFPTSPARGTMLSKHGSLSGPPVRLCIVRHGQSANVGNKSSKNRTRPSKDPGLTDLGSEQAKLLGVYFRQDLHGSAGPRSTIIVSSPMRRCLLTILPTVSALKLPVEDCICHGGAYEFGCVGTAFLGTADAEIEEEFPELRAVGFAASGHWDYQGTHEKEDEEETKERVGRLASFLKEDVANELRRRNTGRHPRTIVFAGHQTIADLLCQLLIEGTDKLWVYSEFRYKLQNAGITELALWPDGSTTVVFKNYGLHLASLKCKKVS